MPRYSLDSNICIYYLKGRYPALRDRLLQTPPNELSISTVVEAELRFGLEKIQAPAVAVQSLESFLRPLERQAFDSKAAAAYARIRAALEAKGTPIGPNDLLIAAIALANGQTLITRNTAEFKRVEGLVLEDWTLE